jgi:RNA polymerase sigma-70 factor (ECF subfamily)
MRHPPLAPRLVAMSRPTQGGARSVRADADAGATATWTDAERLESGLRGGESWAERALLERFTGYVRRILMRILGSAQDLDDLTQEVFIRALDRIGSLRLGADPRRWLAGFAVNVAREALRARSRRRWLMFFSPHELPEPLDDRPGGGAGLLDANADAVRALRATYEVLDQMASGPRAVLALRYLEGMELGEIAGACRQSLATIKRRLARAERTFRARARRHGVLRSWLDEDQDQDGDHDREREEERNEEEPCRTR